MLEDATIIRSRSLPDGFDSLLSESEASGYQFIRRVADEWTCGEDRFDRPGEALHAVEAEKKLVGVCGLSIDPHLNDPRIGRVRNVYVLAEYRGRGFGRRLVLEAIDLARGNFDLHRLRGKEPGPARIYELHGFRPISGIQDCTHILEFDRPVTPDSSAFLDPEQDEPVPDQAVVAMLDDLERGYDGDAWHGPPLRTVLDGVTHEVASARPVPSGHSIWEIIAHLCAWDDVIVHRIQDRRAIENPDGGSFPQIEDSSPEAWDRALAQLEINHEHLLETVAGLDPSRLVEQVAGKHYDIAHMIRGVAQHMAYHVGQIALLRKLAEGSQPLPPPSRSPAGRIQ